VLARFLAYDLFIASVMKVLFTIKMLKPQHLIEEASDSDRPSPENSDRERKEAIQ